MSAAVPDGSADVDLGLLRERERVVAEVVADASQGVPAMARDRRGPQQQDPQQQDPEQQDPEQQDPEQQEWRRTGGHGRGPARGRGLPVVVGGFASGSGVVLALRGDIGVRNIAGLRGLLADVRRQRPAELIVELSALPLEVDPQLARRLARLLGRLRIWCLLDGVRLEVRHPPPALTKAVGA